MGDQPNYQPNENEVKLPTETPKPQSAGNKTFLVTTVLIAIMALIAVGATWSYMDSKQKDQQANNQKQVTQLTTQVKELQQTLEAKPTVTPASTAQATTKNELDTLRAFCEEGNAKDPNRVAVATKFIDYQTLGKFGDCAVSNKKSYGGYRIFAVYQNNKWVKAWEGNGVMDEAQCAKYKIPTAIDSNCSGNY